MKEVQVDNPYLDTFLIKKLAFEWHVDWCGSKNGYQIDMCPKEIDLHAQKMIIVLGSIVNIIEGIHDYLKSTRIFILIMNKIFIQAPKIMRKVATTSIWICYPSCTNHAFHILEEVG